MKGHEGNLSPSNTHPHCECTRIREEERLRKIIQESICKDVKRSSKIKNKKNHGIKVYA